MPDRFIEKGRGEQERDAFHIAGHQPELRGQVVVVIPMEDIHPFIGQGMQGIEEGDEQVGDADKQQVVVLVIFSLIPADDENAEGDDDTEQLCQAVKQEIVL